MKHPVQLWLSVRGLSHGPLCRVFLVAFALLQILAPSWHTCQEGGHLLGNGLRAQCHSIRPIPGHENHHHAELGIAPQQGADLFCLADYLQNFPGQIAVAPFLFEAVQTQPVYGCWQPEFFSVRSPYITRSRAPPIFFL